MEFTNSTVIPKEENKTSLRRNRSMKRRAESKDEDEASKKPRIGATQESEAMQKSKQEYVIAFQEPHAGPALREGIQEIKHEVFASKKPKAGHVFTKQINDSDDGLASAMKPKAFSTLKERIPELEKASMSMNEKASPALKNEHLELSDADVASRKVKASQARESRIPKPSLEKTETCPCPKLDMLETTAIAKNTKSLLSYKDPGSALYGDLIALLSGVAVIPVRVGNLYQMEPDNPKRTAAMYVLVTISLATFMALFATFSKNVWFSRLSMALFLGFIALSSLVDWPHEGECTITALCHGLILMAVMANLSLSFQEKIARLIIIFIIASYASIKNPYSVYLEDTFPLLGGTTLVSIFALYVCHYGACIGLGTVQGARLILGGLFLRHAVISAMSNENTHYENIISLVKGAFVVSIGIAAAGTVQDEILQKEQLENLVQKRTQNLYMVNLALQASETAIAITDKWGCIIWVNTAFERMSGENEEGLVGMILRDVIYNLDTAAKENKYFSMESYDDPSKRNERELKIGESIFYLEATPFSSETCKKDKNVRNDRFLMVFKDITAGRDREVAEKKAQQEAMLAKAMGESMVTLTHELRTPLQGIMGVTSLLLQQGSTLTKDAIHSLKLIMASSTLLLNLINNLLDVKKANAKMMEDFPLMSISASEQIKDAVSYCQPLAFTSNVNLVTDLRMNQNPIVRSNSLRLQQVLINLVSNAIKYSKRGSDIRIHTQATSLGNVRRMIKRAMASSHNDNNTEEDDDMGVLVFSVVDCGPGIARDQASRLFQQFAQLESRPRRSIGGSDVGQPPGTGVGLHLCKLFVNRMNGQIWATNNRKGVDGTTFSFYLPLVSCATYDSVPSAPILNRVSDFRSNSNESAGGSCAKKDKGSVFDYRVLVVDDILINRKVFDRMVKKVGVSYSVTVDSGKKALEELSRNHFDLVITDLQMPGMSGTELSAAIRDSNNLSIVPIVVGLTADTSDDAVTRCIESGMADMMYKPITVSEMKDYFETTVPNLKRGIWYKATTTGTSNNTNGGDSRAQ